MDVEYLDLDLFVVAGWDLCSTALAPRLIIAKTYKYLLIDGLDRDPSVFEG